MSTETSNFNLVKPDVGETNWGTEVDSDLDTIDAALASPFGAPNVVTFSPAALFDLSKGHVQVLTMTGDVTSPLIENAKDGQPYKFIIKQDATGGHTFTFPAAFKGAGAIAPVQGNTSANAVNVQTFTYIQADNCYYADGLMITM